MKTRHTLQNLALRYLEGGPMRRRADAATLLEMAPDLSEEAARIYLERFVALFDENGEELWRQDLPAAQLAADPLVVGGTVLVRVTLEGSATQPIGPTEVIAADRFGLRTILSADFGQQLVGFTAGEVALLRTSNALIAFDPSSGDVAWRSEVALRPAGPHATL